MGNDIHEKINFDYNKYHTMGDALNNNDNIDENMNYKYSRNFNKVNKYETSLGNNIKDQMNVSNSLFLRTSPRRKYNPIEIYLNQDEKLNLKNLSEIELNQFNDFLKLLMIAETEIEEIKKELAKREDFNCGDAFLIFDKDNKGYLTKDDFKKGLNLLNINIDEYLINIIFKRFDLTKKNELNFADFFDMLIPYEKIYRDNIEQRSPESNSQNHSLNLMSKETKEIFKNVLDVIIKYEVEINEKKKEINFLMRKMKEIFYLFDKDGIGFFGFDEYINYLKENNLVEDKMINPDLLFIRLDKNRNGKVIFEELADELEAIY
jgi:Ca2+-binding EF-hand superfamily protein